MVYLPFFLSLTCWACCLKIKIRNILLPKTLTTPVVTSHTGRPLGRSSRGSYDLVLPVVACSVGGQRGRSDGGSCFHRCRPVVDSSGEGPSSVGWSAWHTCQCRPVCRARWPRQATSDRSGYWGGRAWDRWGGRLRHPSRPHVGAAMPNSVKIHANNRTIEQFILMIIMQ